jgi:membrane protease YdiL (CAAX protease family)
VVALAAATLRVALGDFVIDPLTAHFWPPAVAPAGTDELAGNIRLTLLYLPLIWGFAALGEEVSYRGYLLNRAAQAGGASTGAYWLAVLITAVLFGYGHYYKGPAGVVDSGMAGLVLARGVSPGRPQSLGHHLGARFIDTFGLGMAYLGLDA